MTLIIIFILGLIIGSFLNAIIYRLASGESFLWGRSHCRSCNKELQAYDLVPLFSFLYLGGKCRYCKDKISWQYPIIEFITAIIFVLLALSIQYEVFSIQYLFQLIFVCFLIVIAVFDLKHYLILDKVVFPAFILSVLANIFYDFSNHLSFFSIQSYTARGLFASLVIAGFFLIQYLISKGKWIGFGDVKLGLFLGSLAGWPQVILLMLLAYFSGAIVGLFLIALGKKNMGSKLPFGLFLSISAIIVILAGSPIMSWYLSLIGL